MLSISNGYICCQDRIIILFSGCISFFILNIVLLLKCYADYEVVKRGRILRIKTPARANEEDD